MTYYRSVDGCAHEVVRCSACGTDLIGCTHDGGMQLTPGQRQTLTRIHNPKRAPKWRWWYKIIGPPRDEVAYWQGR